MRLVADLGGTNVRFGTLASGRAEPDRVSRFSNDDFGGFAAALERYWASIGRPGIDEAVIAVAGPVTGRKARLTNRDWQVDADEISELLGGAGVVLLNDLNALGHAVPHLGAGDVAVICAHQGDAVPMQQALVVGIGTGFNVSPVLVVGGRVFAQAAEFGHAQLPAGVVERLRADFPELPAMESVEACFSGRGFTRLRQAWEQRADGPVRSGFPDYYAGLLGEFTRDLFLTFLPRSGIYFAGSVAREVLQSPARSGFETVYRQPYPLSAELGAPVYLVLDDAAALRGCAAVPSPG